MRSDDHSRVFWNNHPRPKIQSRDLFEKVFFAHQLFTKMGEERLKAVRNGNCLSVPGVEDGLQVRDKPLLESEPISAAL